MTSIFHSNSIHLLSNNMMSIIVILTIYCLQFNACDTIISNKNKEHKCVTTLANKNEKIYFETFYYVQDEWIQLPNKRENINITGLLKLTSQVNISNCTVITDLVDHQKYLLDGLINTTHRIVPHYHTIPDFISSILFHSSKITCPQTKHTYTQAIISMLTQHISVELVSIVTTHSICDIKFANILKDEIQKKRSEEYSSLFNVRIYKTNHYDTNTIPDNILRSIQKENFNRRAFIMLTPPEITTNYFKISSDIAMNGYNDIWITTHRKYNPDIIPLQTITYSLKLYRVYEPVHKQVVENIIINTDENIQNIIYPTSRNYSESSNDTQSYSFFTDISSTVTFKVWWGNTWKTLHGVNHKQQIFSILPHVETSTSIPGINKILNIVSVIEGPFLFVSNHLFDHYFVKCEKGSLLCTVPIKINNITIWKKTCCYGYSVDLIMHLAELLVFQPNLYMVEDEKYGGFDKDLGKFNGMIGDVYNNKAVMAVAGLTVNTDRSRYVDFTEPFMRSEIGIVTLKHIHLSNYINFNFIAILSPKMKLTISLMFLSAIIIIFVLENSVLFQDRKYDKSVYGSTRIKIYSWRESFTFTSGLLFQRGTGGANPSTKAGRTVALCFTFTMVAFGTLYTASFTAERVIQNDKDKFIGLKDKRMTNPTDKFKFATSKDTSIEAFFKNVPDQTLNRMYHFMLKYNEKNLEGGLEKVLSGELQAYLNEYPFMEYFIAQYRYRTVEIHENTVGQTSYGIAVPKYSHIKSTLSQAILHMRENDELSKLQLKWLTPGVKTKEPEINELSLELFATPLLMLTGVIVLCFIILIGEILIWKFINN